MAKLKLKKPKHKGSVKDGKLPNGVGSSSVVYDDNNIPLVDPPRHKSLLGKVEPPPTDGKVYLEKEKTQGQVEILLLKGVTSPTHIAATLGITFNTAKKYVEQVQYRWAVLGGGTRMRQLRGEAKSRLSLIVSELWVMYSNTKDEKIKERCLAGLINANDRQMLLDGLTPATLPMLAKGEDQPAGSTLEDRMQKHSNLVKLSDALSSYLDKHGKKEEVIEDAEFTEVTEDAQ